MLRNCLNHVLCRRRRDVIRKRAPEFHRWARIRSRPHVWVGVDFATDSGLVRKVVADAVQDANRRQLAALQRMGVV